MLQQQLPNVDKLLQTCLVKLEWIDVFTCDICHAVYCEEETLTKHLATHMNCEDALVNDTERTVRDGDSSHSTQQPYISIRDRIRFESDSGTESSEDSDISFSSGTALCNETLVVNKGLHIPKKVYTKKLIYRRKIAVTSDTDNCGQNRGFQTRRKQKKIQEDKQYFCNVCPKTFQTKRRLHAHLKLHNLEKNVMCKFCERLFMFNYQLKVHLRIHTNERPYSCKICNISFRHYSSMSYHRRSVHRNLNDLTNASEWPTCAICNKQYGQKSILMHHIFKEHKEKGYPCSVCKKEIGHPVARDLHMNLHKATFKCSVCGKCHSRTDNLNRCEISHMKSFECSHCNRKFGRKDHLYRHQRISCKKLFPNLPEKRFKCPNCDSKFIRKDSLTSHLKLPCKPACAKCKLKFSGTLKNRNYKCNCIKYECEYCKRKFVNQKWMSRHIKNNVCRKKFNDYECDHCKKKFVGKKRMARHIINNVCRKKCNYNCIPYECDHCKKKFVSKIWMTRHISNNVCRKN